MREIRSVAVKRIATTHPSAREPTNWQRTDTQSVPKQLQQPGKIRPNGVREAQPFSHEVGGLRQRGKLCQEQPTRTFQVHSLSCPKQDVASSLRVAVYVGGGMAFYNTQQKRS